MNLGNNSLFFVHNERCTNLHKLVELSIHKVTSGLQNGNSYLIMLLDEKSEIIKVIAVNPERDNNICSKFHGNSSSSYQDYKLLVKHMVMFEENQNQ